MANLQMEIEQVEERHAEIEVEQHLAAHTAEQRDMALMVLGGVRVLGAYASVMSADAFKALIQVGEQKIFESFKDENGEYFKRFADFLDSKYSPMSKSAFYDRKALFDKEGEKMFNLFGELGLSIKQRKLLGKGNVEIDGENAIIHGLDGEETIVPIDDHTRLMEVVTALADANAEKSIKIQRQAEKIEKHADEKRELYEENDRIKAARVAEFAADAHMTGRVELGLAFGKFTDIAAALTLVEKEQFRDDVLAVVQGWFSRLRNAYTVRSAAQKTSEPTLEGNTFDEQLDNFLDKVDLDPLPDNDDELIAKL